jgi:hypothetical protein
MRNSDPDGDPRIREETPGWSRNGFNYGLSVVTARESLYPAAEDEETGLWHVPTPPSHGTGRKKDMTPAMKVYSQQAPSKQSWAFLGNDVSAIRAYLESECARLGHDPTEVMRPQGRGRLSPVEQERRDQRARLTFGARQKSAKLEAIATVLGCTKKTGHVLCERGAVLASAKGNF